MISKLTGEERLNWGERSLVAFVALSLALPFAPIPGDGVMQMKVARRVEGSVEPVKAKTQAPMSVCQLLAFSLSYENPATGEYTRVACKEITETEPQSGA